MPNYSFDLKIEAANQEEATEKLQATIILMQKLKAKELRKLADVVKNDPVKTAIAKKALGL